MILNGRAGGFTVVELLLVMAALTAMAIPAKPDRAEAVAKPIAQTI